MLFYNKWIAIFSVLCILGGVALGFAYIKSPVERRVERLDQQRFELLQNQMRRLIAYWRKQGVLPETLAALDRENKAAPPPVDPVTGAPFFYERQSDSRFKLCATFERASQGAWRNETVRIDDSIQIAGAHPAGFHCYEIDLKAK